jgi:hypothetical protein
VLKKIIKYAYWKYFYRGGGKIQIAFTANVGMDSVFGGMNKICPNACFSGEMG